MAAERRRELLAAFRASGLTRRAFARQEGIRYTTFCACGQWEEPADRRPALAAKAAVRFAPESLARHPPACGGVADARMWWEAARFSRRRGPQAMRPVRPTAVDRRARGISRPGGQAGPPAERRGGQWE